MEERGRNGRQWIRWIGGVMPLKKLLVCYQRHVEMVRIENENENEPDLMNLTLKKNGDKVKHKNLCESELKHLIFHAYFTVGYI